MTISITTVLSGDLDNPRHQTVAEEIKAAIEAVLDKYEDKVGIYRGVYAHETIVYTQQREAFKDREFSGPSRSQRQITFTSGFHLNPDQPNEPAITMHPDWNKER